MGTYATYDTTIDKLIEDLQALKKIEGVTGETRVTMPNPGHFDVHFDGHESKLTAIYIETDIYPGNRAIIVEQASK